ncbi:MAG TPA: DUF3047 domain-containing protein, partial [Desulfobacteraceae bacterium]|nr:DUF3047 domain-containing protein [Desulfobacteraceae bacterium]
MFISRSLMKQTVGLFFILVIFTAAAACRAQEYAIDEQFDNLDDWEPITFPKIEKHSTYEISTGEAGSMLVARSNGSASGIRHTEEFDVYAYPIVRWKWKVGNVYARGNVEEKSGDDYPLRVYVMFKYDPQKASFGERVKYGLAKTLNGAYPPKSSLNYIWANRPHENRIYPSPYTDRARLIILRAGGGETGQWVEEQVNIIDDYQQAFGSQPPETASIAIMNDSDNTGESAESWMEYIQVLR